MLLTTHYMFEADALCDRIAVIAKGEIVAEGTPRELKDRVADGRVVEVEVFGGADERLADVRGLGGVTGVAVEEREQAQVLVVQTEPGAELTHALLAEPRRRAGRARLLARADARGRVRALVDDGVTVVPPRCSASAGCST